MTEPRDEVFWYSGETPHGTRLDRDLTVDAVVVGGGMAGLTCAQFLREGGLSVALLVYFPALFGLQSFAQARGLIAVRRLAEEQREEIARQGAQLAQARDAAEQASRAKSVFLANMSHELRTPLNAVIGYSEMMEEEAVEQGHQQYVPDLRKIRAAGRHLLSLINSVLDLSKVEAGKMELHPETFEVPWLVEEVAVGRGASQFRMPGLLHLLKHV